MNLRPLCFLTLLALVSGLASASPKKILAIADSGNDRVFAFDPYDGHFLNQILIFDLKAFGGAGANYTAKEVLLSPKGTYFVSDQAQGAVLEFDKNGNYLSTVCGPAQGLSNIRGIAIRRNKLYVTVADGVWANTVQAFDLTTGAQSTFLSGNMDSPWDVLFMPNKVLVSNSGASDDITRFALTGAPSGTFHNGLIQFTQQMALEPNGRVLACGFSGGSNSGVYEFDTNGIQTGFWAPASGARGAYRLGNGNIIYTHGIFVAIIDTTTGISTDLFLGGSWQYVSLIDGLQTVDPHP